LDPGGAQVFFAPLFNDGEGKNYGIDLTLEHPLKKGYYLLLTGSLYRSLYKAYDNKWRNTAWNGSFMTSLSTGKEIVFSDSKTLSFNLNVNYSGGRRYTPIDENASKIAGEAVFDNNQLFEKQLPNYFRADFNISYKMSGKKITQKWQIDLRNITNHKNIFSQRFSKIQNKIVYTYQMGFFPVLQYRILF
jgi:outer membrane receptor protein involved in Fe transport